MRTIGSIPHGFIPCYLPRGKCKRAYMVGRLAFLTHPGMVCVNARNVRKCRLFLPFAISEEPTVTGIGRLKGAIFVTVVTFGV